MSAIKYKIGFTINAETLFTLVSKLLPVDDFTVQEMVERPAPDPAIRFDKRFDLPKPKPKPKPPRAPQVRKTRGSGFMLNPDAGANKIILTMLADGKPHHAAEVDGLLKEAGYSVNGLYGYYKRLQRYGYVFQPGKGLWQLKPPTKE